VSSADRQELFNTYDALAAGAVDVLEKPVATPMTTSGAPACARRSADLADPGDQASRAGWPDRRRAPFRCRMARPRRR
jgi:hypothetical protein